MFVNRAKELASFKQWLAEPRPGLARLYGRRRLGKTELLRAFCARTGGVYFLVDEADEPRVLASLAEQWAQQAETLRPVFRTWDDFYTALARLEAPVVVLDEFQRLMNDHKIAVTRLQHHWDAYLKHSAPSLVLCGSSIGMMQRLTHGSKGPLFGRIGFDMRLSPFRFAHMRLLYPAAETEDLVRRYAVFGGTPYYHEYSKGRSLKEAIHRSFLQDNAPLIDEPQNLLRIELRSPLRYNSIMYEIGHGTHDTKTLEDKVGVKTGGLGPYLRTLKDDMDLLRLENPLSGRKKQARYVFSDPFFSFYYRFVFDARPKLEIGRATQVWKDLQDRLEAYVGQIYEDIVRQTLVHANGRKVNGVLLDFDEIGKWWNRKGEEIDVVAVGKKEILAGEVKWTKHKVGPEVLERLLEKIPHLERTGDRPIRPLIATRNGMTQRAEDLARKKHALVLSLNDLQKITGAVRL